jgi:AhpD family alkylhydroperoxidase
MKETIMTTLSHRDRELVALGAALAANCIPCIQYHVPEARKAGLTEAEIGEAVELAEKIKRVPADKVLETATGLLGLTGGKNTDSAPGCNPAMIQMAKSCC